MTKKYNKDQSQRAKKKDNPTGKNNMENMHLGSSNAFEETENLKARDEEEISDEKLDDLIGDD
jgi:hypothetical protein